MNVVGIGTLHADLRADELRMVENAVRLAIDSIINVLNGVNSARNAEYQRLVGDRDKQIQRLERRLKELEQELTSVPQPLHRRCPCGVAERTSGPGGLDEEEMTEVPQQCDWIPPRELKHGRGEDAPISYRSWTGICHPGRKTLKYLNVNRLF